MAAALRYCRHMKHSSSDWFHTQHFVHSTRCTHVRKVNTTCHHDHCTINRIASPQTPRQTISWFIRSLPGAADRPPTYILRLTLKLYRPLCLPNHHRNGVQVNCVGEERAGTFLPYTRDNGIEVVWFTSQAGKHLLCWRTNHARRPWKEMESKVQTLLLLYVTFPLLYFAHRVNHADRSLFPP